MHQSSQFTGFTTKHGSKDAGERFSSTFYDDEEEMVVDEGYTVPKHIKLKKASKVYVLVPSLASVNAKLLKSGRIQSGSSFSQSLLSEVSMSAALKMNTARNVPSNGSSIFMSKDDEFANNSLFLQLSLSSTNREKSKLESFLDLGTPNLIFR